METFTHPGKLPRPQDSAKPLMMIESVSAPGWKHAELQTLECAARLILGLEGGRRVRFFFFFLFFWRWGLGWGSLHWWLRCVCLCLSKMRKHSEPVTACAFTTLNLRPYSLKGAGQAPANSAQKQKAVCQEHHLLRDIVILMGARRRCFFLLLLFMTTVQRGYIFCFTVVVICAFSYSEPCVPGSSWGKSKGFGLLEIFNSH